MCRTAVDEAPCQVSCDSTKLEDLERVQLGLQSRKDLTSILLLLRRDSGRSAGWRSRFGCQGSKHLVGLLYEPFHCFCLTAWILSTLGSLARFAFRLHHLLLWWRLTGAFPRTIWRHVFCGSARITSPLAILLTVRKTTLLSFPTAFCCQKKSALCPRLLSLFLLRTSIFSFTFPFCCIFFFCLYGLELDLAFWSWCHWLFLHLRNLLTF